MDNSVGFIKTMACFIPANHSLRLSLQQAAAAQAILVTGSWDFLFYHNKMLSQKPSKTTWAYYQLIQLRLRTGTLKISLRPFSVLTRKKSYLYDEKEEEVNIKVAIILQF